MHHHIIAFYINNTLVSNDECFAIKIISIYYAKVIYNVQIQILQMSRTKQWFPQNPISLLQMLIIILSLQLTTTQTSGLLNEDISATDNQNMQSRVPKLEGITDGVEQNSVKANEIYGVRWFVSDYFAYSNLYKTHKTYPYYTANPLNTNYYILAFNSQQKFQQDMYVQIIGTMHTCSHRQIQVNFTQDHQFVELKPQAQSNNTVSNIYRCYINVDFSKYWKQAKAQKIVNDTEGSGIWKQYPYSIFTQYPEFAFRNKTNNSDSTINRKVQNKRILLFQGKFRAPIPVLEQELSTDKKLQQNSKIEQNVLVLGDWGIISQEIQKSKKYIPVLQSLVSKVEEDKSIVLVLFLGDLAYDLVGEKYRDILIYLQPLLSRVCFMATPGNHDYVYHADSFELFAETFLSPEWSKYYDFYYNFVLGDVLFINYVPQNMVEDASYEINAKPLEYIINDFYSHYAVKLGQQNKMSQATKLGSVDPIQKQYHVIVFSHYPIFCSKTNDDLDTCNKNKDRLAKYLNTFTDIGMDLYFSGHLHYYERTHGICWNQTNEKFHIFSNQKQQNGKDIYKENCPVYIIEGVGGNNYFEQQDGAIKPTQFTSKIAYNTGFGVLSILTQSSKFSNSQSNIQNDEFHYTHFRMTDKNKTEISDEFVKKLPLLSQYEKNINAENNNVYIDNDPQNVRIMEMLAILTLILIGSTVCFIYGRFYVRNFGQKMTKKKKTDHVEMVEQNLNSVISQCKHEGVAKKTSTQEQDMNH